MAGKNQQLGESALIMSLRRFRDKYFPAGAKLHKDYIVSELGTEEPQLQFLDSLPV